MDVRTVVANAKARMSAIDTHLENDQEQSAKTELQLMASDIANALREPSGDPAATASPDGDKPTAP